MHHQFRTLLLATLLVLQVQKILWAELVFPGETWQLATPEEMLVDQSGLDRAIAQLPDSSRTMVVRNGRVIWQGENAHVPHEVFSITKAFASTGLGLLVDDGVLSLD